MVISMGRGWDFLAFDEMGYALSASRRRYPQKLAPVSCLHFHRGHGGCLRRCRQRGWGRFVDLLRAGKELARTLTNMAFQSGTDKGVSSFLLKDKEKKESFGKQLRGGQTELACRPIAYRPWRRHLKKRKRKKEWKRSPDFQEQSRVPTPFFRADKHILFISPLWQLDLQLHALFWCHCLLA